MLAALVFNAPNINFALRFDMAVADPARMFVGRRSTSDLAAEALDLLVNDDKMHKLHQEMVALQQKLS